jgi:hypothetical protein
MFYTEYFGERRGLRLYLCIDLPALLLGHVS